MTEIPEKSPSWAHWIIIILSLGTALWVFVQAGIPIWSTPFLAIAMLGFARALADADLWIVTLIAIVSGALLTAIFMMG